MRWTKTKLKYGDKKIKKKFAILPIRIDNEIRWLEWVTVRYRCHIDVYGEPYWCKEKFVD